MKRTITLLLYYFASQLITTCIAMAYYFGKEYITQGAFPANAGMPISTALIANLASILFMIWIMLRKNYIRIDKTAVNPGKARIIIIYTLIGITTMIWMNFLSDIINLPDLFKSTFASMQNSILGIATMVIIAPIFEEMMFRGAIEKHLLDIWSNPRYAIVVSALIFGIIHINPAQVLFAFLFGLILGEVYYRTRSLTACIILHSINNTTSVIMMMAYSEDATITDIFGFNNMAVAAIISGIAFIILMKIFIDKTKTSPQG